MAIYHVLLIGIDRYPPGFNSLWGCVNDIDAIEELLFGSPGIGIPRESMRIRRLAAPHPGHPSSSRFLYETLAPTKANVIEALKDLAGPAVKSNDRVLIYYSGHGYEKLWTGSPVWHETLVLCDKSRIEHLFDVEINELIHAVSQRTSDLTIIFDCCHSAGATRDLSGIQAEGRIRSLQPPMSEPLVVPPPDPAALGRAAGSHMLQSPDPNYIVIAACQSDEKAYEGAGPAASNGVFTQSLLSVLSRYDSPSRAELRWADIWPKLLAGIADCNARLKQRAQHPWMIGRSERKVFGGRWEKMDSGYSVTRRPDGVYEVGAGMLTGVTEGAEIAVYGAEPLLFPPIGSRDDIPIGRLKITRAAESGATATPAGEPFDLPDGARGRMVQPGESARLRVSFKPHDPELESGLGESPMIEIVPSTDPDAEIEVITRPDGRRIIGNEIEPMLAIVPAGEIKALRSGLEHYYRYNTVLRLARNCNDPRISNSLTVRILDCNDETALKSMSPRSLADPGLPEAPRDRDRIYAIEDGFRFCVRVTNNSGHNLNVTLLNCSAGGQVEYLSDALIRAGSSYVMWLESRLGEPFVAGMDELPAGAEGISRPDFATERLIAVGTTRTGIRLDYLKLDKRVQEVVNRNLSKVRRADRQLRPVEKTAAAPAELWTATVTPIRIARGRS